jgi:hypothetical protein
MGGGSVCDGKQLVPIGGRPDRGSGHVLGAREEWPGVPAGSIGQHLRRVEVVGGGRPDDSFAPATLTVSRSIARWPFIHLAKTPDPTIGENSWSAMLDANILRCDTWQRTMIAGDLDRRQVGHELGYATQPGPDTHCWRSFVAAGEAGDSTIKPPEESQDRCGCDRTVVASELPDRWHRSRRSYRASGEVEPDGDHRVCQIHRSRRRTRGRTRHRRRDCHYSRVGVRHAGRLQFFQFVV